MTSDFKIFVWFYEIPSQLPLLQVNRPSSFIFSSQGKCSSLTIFVPLAGSSQSYLVFLELPSPELNPSPPSTWSYFFWYCQDMIAFLSCIQTPLAYVQLFVHRLDENSTLQILFCGAGCSQSIHPSIPQPVMILGIVLTQVQHFVLGLTGVHEVPLSSLLKSIRFLWMSSLPYSVSAVPLHVISKTAEGALYLTGRAVDWDSKQYCPHKYLENITPHSPLKHWAIYCSSLDMVIQKILHPTLPVDIPFQFGSKSSLGFTIVTSVWHSRIIQQM